MSNVNQLKVLSLNCWGLAVVAKSRAFRLKSIADALAKENYDIITLQEVWVQSDFELIQASVKHTLPYTKYFYSGALGSGLAILSKFPIVSTTYHRYTLNGKPLKFWHGDYYVGKGVGSVVVEHPTLCYLEIFNTHLHAGYGPQDQYKAHRATECWQLANLLRASAAMGRHIILSGDFNSTPDSFNYRLICDHGFMCDSWLKVDVDSNYNSRANTEDYIQFFGFTCNSPCNTFSRHYKNPDKTLGKRLDYIFSSTGLCCIDAQVVMTGLIPGSNMSYSDHFGVLAIFDLTKTAKNVLPYHNPSFTHLSPDTIDDILNGLQLELQNAKQHANYLLYAFGLGILVQIVLYITVISVSTILFRHRLAIILITVLGNAFMNIVSVLVPVCLIVGFVVGRTEQRALLQFIDEIKTTFRR